MKDSVFVEMLHSGLSTMLIRSKVLIEKQTSYQHLQIFDNPTLGRVMALDHIVQTSERDEAFYHEMMVHVPMIAHGNAKKVLIIGAGDGGILEEVLKHPVQKATMVELDGDVIEASKIHLGSICGDAFDDPRAEIIVGDGAEFMRTTNEQYDVILIDSTDPVGPGLALFQKAFYQNCLGCLDADKGILVTQNGVPFYQPQGIQASYTAFKALFKDAWFYTVAVPLYVGGMMTLGWASNDKSARQLSVDALRARLDALEITGLKYYTPEIHMASFSLPNYIKDCFLA